MQFHLSIQCPEENVLCKYIVNGCDAVVKRRDREKHESDDSLHVQMLIRSQAQLLQLVTKCLMAKSWDSADVTSLPLSSRPWLQNTPTCYPVPPCVVKFEGIRTIRNKSESYSVYSHFGGYEFKLFIERNARELFGTRDNTYLIMDLQKDSKNPHLSFPFKGMIQVTLLNQMEDGTHRSVELGRVTLCRPSTSSVYGYCYDVHDFAFRLDLNFITSLHKTSPFLPNDCVFFRVDKITNKF